MTDWRRTLDLKEEWDWLDTFDEDVREDHVPELVVKVIQKIKNAAFYDLYKVDLDYIVERFKTAKTMHTFNRAMNVLWDWADSHKVWVKTVF